MQTLTAPVLLVLVEESRQAQPCEACGVLMAEGVLCVPNHSPTPEDSFEMNEQELALAMSALSEMTEIGIPIALWHSHPTTRAMMSRSDCELMQRVQLPMIVVSLSAQVPIIRCYEWGARGPVEVANYRVTT